LIRFLKEKDIDTVKWDNCIANAQCELPYAYTYYLRLVCKNWGGLILNNYEAVMPLPYAYKFGLPYIYQPYFTQQLGIYTSLAIKEKIINQFTDAIPKKYFFISTQLNYTCSTTSKKIKHRKNLILQLNKPYTEIYSKFSENTKRNIKQAEKQKLQLQLNAYNPEKYALFYKEHNPIEKSKHTELILEKIIRTTTENKKGETWSAHSATGNLLAFAHFLKERKRVVYIAPASSAEGKKQKAMFFLINEFCKKHSENNLIVDFEGSELVNVARFYEAFGAEKELYPIYLKKYFFF
jgi:hypothetical protein